MAKADDVHSTSTVALLHEDELLNGIAVLSGHVARLHDDLRHFMSTASDGSADRSKDPFVVAMEHLVDSLIAALNDIAGDPDLEDGDEDANTGDEEPSLGASELLEQPPGASFLWCGRMVRETKETREAVYDQTNWFHGCDDKEREGDELDFGEGDEADQEGAVDDEPCDDDELDGGYADDEPVFNRGSGYGTRRDHRAAAEAERFVRAAKRARRAVRQARA